MGLLEAFETIILGVLITIVISQSIVIMFPDLSSALGNAQVFPLGGITISLIGFIPIVLIIGIIKRTLKDTEQERENVQSILRRE